MLGKIAAARSNSILQAIHASLPRADQFVHGPIAMQDRDRLIRTVRREMRGRMHEPNVPLPLRVQNYKNWKETGHLGVFRHLGHIDPDSGAYGPDRRWYHQPVRPGAVDHVSEPALTPGNELVTLHSYGRDKSLRKALKDPGTYMDHPVLRPGQLKPERHGLYFTADPALHKRYTSHGEGDPAMLTMQIPRSKVLSWDVKGGEHAVPADVIRAHAASAQITPVSI